MKRSELFFTAIAVPTDFIALVAAGVTAYQLRFLPQFVEIRPVIFQLPFSLYFPWVAVSAGAGILIFAFARLYQIIPVRKFGDEFSRVALACSTLLAGVVLTMFYSRYLFDSRFILATAWLLGIFFVTAARFTMHIIQRQLYRIGIGAHRLVLIGACAVASDLRREFEKRPTLGYRVVEQYPTFDPQVGKMMSELARDDKIDEVVQAGAALNQQQTLELVNLVQEHHLDYRYTADLLGTKVANFEILIQAGVPVVEVKRTRLNGWGRIWKRAFDVVLAALLIIILSPVMALVALAIGLDSGRPIFFTYTRVGERGKRFRFIKFRSMVPGSHHLRYDSEFASKQNNLRAGTPMIKFKNDPRVTRVGRVLRRWSLDELPQFFLVIAGSMSLVGPRPHETEEVARYSNGQRQLLAVRPGITGLAQVSGRSDLDFNEEVKLDSFYIQNWSPWLDMQILFKTPLAILRRPKAE